ncbi:hypothetical protein MYCTH_2107175 [Thermothelomyces thermophilus ATCC 42464]|uniref:Uncharacterized protein n=1 Tax=Thermothelomyces thermophilus (strain ATCC 42464 / BCRC 31852 / DSM 1799) TaxID=573729 RepID=G2Q3T4_THET4|nr:uncharacterized protein MYCTH_2107175 [Thermothelomyces thermophilus ATCC 42464]AEO54437.1 hypothetical protein MYCTH_2107175 [Thermothelomyces thermophilus ATCC 42464]
MGGAFLFLYTNHSLRVWNTTRSLRASGSTYTHERKIEVLINLLNCREPDACVTRFPRRRIGQSYERERMLSHRMVREPNGAFVRYRAPTYRGPEEDARRDRHQVARARHRGRAFRSPRGGGTLSVAERGCPTHTPGNGRLSEERLEHETSSSSSSSSSNSRNEESLWQRAADLGQQTTLCYSWPCIIPGTRTRPSASSSNARETRSTAAQPGPVIFAKGQNREVDVPLFHLPLNAHQLSAQSIMLLFMSDCRLGPCLANIVYTLVPYYLSYTWTRAQKLLQ